MKSGPSLGELRSKVQKPRHQEIGNWLARKVARPTAIYGTWLAVRLNLKAHQVTLGSLFSSLLGAIAIGTGQREGLLAGVLLLHLGFWLDHVDGQVARWRGTAGLSGVYFDYLMHHVTSMALGFALGMGVAVQAGNLAWSVVGFMIATGWVLLGLHNDCRYKAFFQILKSSNKSFQIDGGAGGRPEPAPGWQFIGWKMVSWPLLKLCEPHVVLGSLSLLAILALIPGDTWMLAWRGYAGALACIAPVLAAVRIARTIVRDTTTQEFNCWFRPLDNA